jgi:hypothetical protein
MQALEARLAAGVGDREMFTGIAHPDLPRLTDHPLPDPRRQLMPPIG